MRVRTLAAAILVSLAAACADSDEARVLVAATLSPPLDLSMLTVTVRDGLGARTLPGSDFQATPDLATPHAPELATSTTGSLEISVVVRDTAGDSVSAGSVQVPLLGDWRWNFAIAFETADPARVCLGCVGSRAFAVADPWRTAGHDSLWIVWGGNSIKHPVVF